MNMIIEDKSIIQIVELTNEKIRKEEKEYRKEWAQEIKDAIERGVKKSWQDIKQGNIPFAGQTSF